MCVCVPAECIWREGHLEGKRDGRLSSPTFSSPVQADTLDPSATTPISSQHHPSESSFQEPLNYSPALRSSSSSESTFSPFDFPSSTTASQQSPWLSSPAPHASRLQLNTSHTEFARPHSDFVLYDQPAQAPRQPQPAPSVAQSGHLFNTGHSFYANSNSAPSSTTEFQAPQLQQHQLQQQQRPPVPLFPSSRNSIPQNSNVATMADLNSNNSFDSGARLFAGVQSDASPWEAPNSAFTAINPSVSGSMRTVSPKDLFVDPLQSAPPSTTFTNITSPDIDASPFDFTDSFETSPMFSTEGLVASDNWFSLFPEEDAKLMSPPTTTYAAPIANVLSAAPELERTASSTSADKSSVSSANSPVILDRSTRRKSSVNGSPVTNASVSKSRRRKGPLPAIAVDPTDKVALKRARNTLAARDSRQRKFDHVNTLEKRNAELEAEVEKWKSIAIAQGYSGA
ncbi:unnamed protein product [Periconia digitata]|uniref:BZIP domain-containing protein n=1 Tax=Periconia digitata TaxID=1303443 RepID=A0A9W4XD99_9PLEO|nr:unnamed protein product [Periconia digitata]